MDRPSSSYPVQPRRELKTHYLLAYNLVSSILWFAVLARVLLLIPLVGFAHVSGGVGEFAKWTQILAVLEVVHSALGLIRSPLPTALLQVLSRLFLVWAICAPYPTATTPSPFYSTMLLAWSLTEVVRYSYFVFTLRGGVPAFEGTEIERRIMKGIAWARYNFFYALYPLGICSECVLVWKAGGEAGGWVQLGCWAVLGAYVPGE
ncbi:MAG: hypothetical protein Q9195_003469 [Heterodermia aff. obscurata]